jgi:hypothetical protein
MRNSAEQARGADFEALESGGDGESDIGFWN